MRGLTMGALRQDVRYGVRQLARAPAFTSVAVITLALAIGANTAIFGAVDAVLLRALPYADAGRVATLWQTNVGDPAQRDDLSPANFLDVRERSRSFEALAAAEPYTNDVLGADGPERLQTWRVTEGFFDVFGVGPLLGRTFRPSDHEPGASGAIVLGYRAWQSRFGGDPQVIGRTLAVEGVPATIVGVMPPGFAFPAGRDYWVARAPQGFERERRTGGFWLAVGKLAPGVDVSTAQAELDSIAAQLANEHPETNGEVALAATPLVDTIVGPVRSALLLFAAAVGFVLLIACVNVASLMLARAAARRREFVIRGVLGADRKRVLRQVLTESLMLAGFGGAAGLVFASVVLRLFEASMADALPREVEIAFDARVVAFAGLLTLGTAVLVGLTPALDSARANLQEWLHSSAQFRPGPRRTRRALVVSQVALAVVLLVSAGLLLRSFVALASVERGYRTDNVLALTVQAWRHYPELDQRVQFVAQTLERIAALPGIRAASVASTLPLAEDIGADLATFTISGRPETTAELPSAHTTVIAGDYLGALGIALRGGRAFAPTDNAGAPRVALINEAMARRHWPGEDPIGATIAADFSGVQFDAQIVGIVADFRQADLRDEPRPALLLPHAQYPTGALHFVVRTSIEPASMIPAVRTEIQAMNPTMPLAGTATLDGLLDGSLHERRITMLLVVAFSSAALALAAIGIFGVLSFETSRRSQEIGVRMALGARRRWVLALIMREGLKLVLIGIGVGLALAFVAARLLSGFLFGVAPFDPVTFAGIPLLLLAITLLASYLPARKAASVNPMVVLKRE